MAIRGKTLRAVVLLAAVAGGLGGWAVQAKAVDGGGSDIQYWVTSGGNYCAGKCSSNIGPCC